MGDKLELGASPLRSLATSPSWRAYIVAIALSQLGVALLNSAVFPLYNGICLEARDLGTGTSVIVALGIWMVSVRNPRFFQPKAALVINSALLLVGLAIYVPSILFRSAWLLVIATCLRCVAQVWFNLLAMLPLVVVASRHGKAATVWTIIVSWALLYPLEFAVSLTPQAFQFFAFCLCPFVTQALCYRQSSEVFEHSLSALPAADLRVTHPLSFLPLSSALFVTIILLKMSFGFAMTFASVDATPQQTVLACVPAMAVALIFALTNKASLDAFYKATFLCVLAGFLLVNPLIDELMGVPALSNVVLRAGSDLTRMLIYLIAATVGSRNMMNAVNVSLFVTGANSLGTLVGAQLGIAANTALANDSALFSLLLSCIVFFYVAYNVISPGDFQFDRVAAQIQPVVEPEPLSPSDAIARACASLSEDRGLTPRESEALELLAHGRNTQAIQDRMVVSRSTAKTHIRNVYCKLGVHSQQELIDMVEAAK